MLLSNKSPVIGIPFHKDSILFPGFHYRLIMSCIITCSTDVLLLLCFKTHLLVNLCSCVSKFSRRQIRDICLSFMQKICFDISCK